MNEAFNGAVIGAKERTRPANSPGTSRRTCQVPGQSGGPARRHLRMTAFLRFMIAVLLIMATSFSGCGAAQQSGKSDGQDDGRIRIVTTIFPPYDFARAIAGDEAKADITMLLSPGEEIHSYEPTPMDIKKIQNSDLFIYTGGDNDVWVDRILENMGDKKPQTLRLVDLTDTVAEEVVEGMMEERGHEHDHGEEHDHEEADGHGHSSHVHSGDSSEEEHEEADEHVWTSPVKAAEITEAIAAKMAEIDPDNAESYMANAAAYVEEIMKVDAAYREIVDNAERRTIVFGDRFPLRYFAEEYGLEYFAAFPGCSSEAEPSASTLAFLIDKVREEQIPVVFSIEFSNGNIARAICESSGAVARTFNSCHNVTREQMEGGETYVSLMTENLDAVREALGAAKEGAE